MKPNSIKSFSIYGLFGTNDVHIPFDENIKILIGENGLGKTQVLNLLYYTLKRNFFKLNEFNFEKLVLHFSSSHIEITKEQISDLTKELYKHPVVEQFINEFGYNEFEFLRNKLIQSRGNTRKLQMEFDHNTKYRKYPFHRIIRVFEELENNKQTIFNTHINDCEEKINQEITGQEIMYFPTFRRVEEDLHNLGYEDDDFLNQDNTLIQFGMEDVQKRFNQVQNTIDQLLKKGISKFMKDILKIVVTGSQTVDKKIFERINDQDLELIFSRIGSELEPELKDAVKETLRHQDFKTDVAGFLLQKLVELYEKQKEIDNSVKVFRDVCNKYLINKKVFYDESAIKIYIKSDITNNEISLSKLSSGEKQIISIFSKVYLSEADKRFIVLFDEPELSLSIFWQKNLLPDIVNSGKCDFMLAVTHSPFIFDNELDKYAIGLSEYFQPLNSLAV